MEQRGFWFDGKVAIERPVGIGLDSNHLILTESDGSDHRVDPADLVKLGGSAQLRYGHRSKDGWRLVVAEPVDPAILALLPTRAGSVGPTVGRRTVAGLATVAFVFSLLAALVIFAPEVVASQLPMSWERRLGAAYDLPVTALHCEDAKAQAALDRILDRLDRGARSDGLAVELADLDIPNAAALPGGRMIVLNGLFEDIDDPDALAGIIAHEIAHIRRRHVAAAMVRELGLGTVVTLLGGGAIASNAGGLLSLRFSRSAEAEADADAIAMLKQARIDPRPTAAAFEEFRKHEGDWPEWLGSHPASGGRAKQFASSYDPRAIYRPVLGRGETKALLAACQG